MFGAKRKKVMGMQEVTLLAIGSSGRFLIVAPLLCLPILVDSRQRPDGLGRRMAGRGGQPQHQRSGHGDKIVNRHQLKGGKAPDPRGKPGQRSCRLFHHIG